MKETLPKSVQELILSLREKLKDEPEIVDMFERCYSNTLDTTVKKMEDGSTYVITGDIPAMWLRDSVAQLRPYLVPAQNDPLKLMGVQTETEKEMGLLEKLTQYIKVMAELLQKELVILVNIRSYLNETQINKLSQMACYYEISLLFIENIQRDFSNQREYYIIDKDGCDVY